MMSHNKCIFFPSRQVAPFLSSPRIELLSTVYLSGCHGTQHLGLKTAFPLNLLAKLQFRMYCCSRSLLFLYQGLNLRPYTCWTNALPLSCIPSRYIVVINSGILTYCCKLAEFLSVTSGRKMESESCLPQLSSEHI